MLMAIVPSGGISQSSGAPVAAGSTTTLFIVGVQGDTIAAAGLVTLYNISTLESVPANALALVQQTENGHYYCSRWAGQVSPAAIVHASGSPNHKGF